MSSNPQVLIAVNNLGFMAFLMKDVAFFKEKGYDVIVTGDNSIDESVIIGKLQDMGATVIDIRCSSSKPFDRTNVSCFRSYRDLLGRLDNLSLIVCHTPIIGLIVRLAAMGKRRKGTRIIYMNHGLAWTPLSGFKSKLVFSSAEWLGSHLCDRVITINEADASMLRKLHCPRVCHVNGVGCDTSRYLSASVDRETKLRELGISPSKTVILAIGAVTARKNHIAIVRALATMEKRSDYGFVIAGRPDPGVKQQIQDEADANGIEVIFLGHRPDIEQLIYCADIGVIPSVREELGMAGIQQLCAGTPLVGTAVQGIKEYIIDGVTGYTVANPYDYRGFASAITRLSDSEHRSKMAQACRDIVRKFDNSVALSQRFNIYNDVIGN